MDKILYITIGIDYSIGTESFFCPNFLGNIKV